MNFSALNTHAIGVQSTVSASAEVHEGAGSFSTGASVSAQAILHSHAVASAINSVALTTTQSVVRFAMATATLGCSAAANVEGYRVQFSNAQIVCAANSAANAIVTYQAVASVAASGSVVSLGSRVAFATASLLADAHLTANSGGVIFGLATGITASAVCSAAASIESNAQATAACNASVSSSAIAETPVQAEAHVLESSYVQAGYTTWYDSWANSTGSYYVANSGNYHIFQAVPGLYPPDYQVFSASSSLAPISQANTGYSYRVGALISYDTYYIDGVYITGYWKHLEVNTPYSVYTPPATVYTGYTPNALVVVAECFIQTGTFAYPTGSAQLTTDASTIHSASASVSASAGFTSTPVSNGLVFGTASVSASASANASAGSHTLYTEVGTFAASSSVAASASIVHLVQASISSSSTTTAVGQRLIIASAPVTDTGYTAPSYDTTEDFLAAAYWERDDGQELVITGIWESIAPYSATTYSGNNYIATIRNTLNAGAAAGTSYVTSLSGVAYRDGLRGYNGSIKRRVTTTHPAVFVFTGTSPSAYVTADCTVFTSVQLYAYANASSTAVNTANAQGVFTGSSITISAGNGIVRVRAEVNASSNAVASANVESFVQGQVDATASASGSQYVESPASSVITASANTTSDTFIAVFATSNSITADAQVVESAVNTANAQGTFNGSSVTISAGDYSRVGRADFTASSELSASDFRVYAWREAHASASSSVLATDVLLVHVQADVIASASVLLDYQLNVHGQGDFVGSGAIVSASHVTPFAEFGVTSQALISADADYQRYGKANVVAQASVAVVGLGVNSASADLNSSADLTATPSILKIVSSTSVNAQANFVNGFAIVAQEGSRSNGILILVEAEDRSITVEAPDREFIAEAEIRIIFVDAA